MVGAAGLTALASLQSETASLQIGVVATPGFPFGNLDNIQPNITAAQIYVGTSLESTIQDHITGIVASNANGTDPDPGRGAGGPAGPLRLCAARTRQGRTVDHRHRGWRRERPRQPQLGCHRTVHRCIRPGHRHRRRFEQSDFPGRDSRTDPPAAHDFVGLVEFGDDHHRQCQPVTRRIGAELRAYDPFAINFGGTGMPTASMPRWPITSSPRLRMRAQRRPVPC